MKSIILTITTIVCLITASVVLTSMSGDVRNMKHAAGAPAGRCGDPANNFNDCTNGCHSDNSATSVAGWISSNIPESGYQADSTYTITAICMNSSSPKSGFQISPQSSHGMMMGTMTNLSPQTQLITGNGCQYITHTSADSGNLSSTSTKTWTFKWTAPHTGDSVTFYGAFCASDNDGTDQGDAIYLSTYSITNSAYAGIPEVSNEPILNIYPTLVTDNMHLSYSLHGIQNVTIALVDINGRVCETLFAGTQNAGTQDLSLNLNTNHAAGVYFVRVTAEGFNTIKKIIIQ